MNFHNVNGERWGWQEQNYGPLNNSNHNMSQCVWNEVTLNEEDHSYANHETTPVKSCWDASYHANHENSMSKEPEECREPSSQSKRRRMLQFDTLVEDSYLCNEQISTAFLKSNEAQDSLEECFSQAPQFPGFSDMSDSSYEDQDRSCEDWLAQCINDAEMHFSIDDMNLSGTPDIQIDVSDLLCSEPPEFEVNAVQKLAPRTPRNIVFRASTGQKSFLRAPTKLPSSIVYPFAFIKPCGVDGDVTLKDINQRIRTPPPSKTPDEHIPYPTSAFSGKPVVEKTKIRTEGGSITVMRTKG